MNLRRKSSHAVRRFFSGYTLVKPLRPGSTPRKYLVTEEQTFTVPVTREEVELDYAEIPPDRQVPDGTGSLVSDEVEVVRYEERVVVTKQVVAVERVRLVRRVVTADQVVTGQVRREVVDIDHFATTG